MTAGELMIRTFETVHPDAQLEDVARKLKTSGMSLLPVCRDGVLVGTITHEDVTHRDEPAALRRVGAVRASDLVAPDLLFCFENTDVNEAANLMKESRVRLIPVLSPSKTVVGVLSLESIPGQAEADTAEETV